MVKRRVSILVRVWPAGTTDGGRKDLRWCRALVKSLILSFSLSLAVWRFLPGYLDLDLLVLELEEVQARVCVSGAGLEKKPSRGVCSGPAAWRDAGEKLKESTEDVGDRLLLALKYPGSIAGSGTTCW